MDDNDATDDENENDNTFDTSALNMADENDFYKLLNINPNATQEEIRGAYKRRALEFHPDKNTTDTTGIFQAVKAAYEILSDERRRMEYDADADVDKDDDDDDDDADEIFSTVKGDQKGLHMGAKFSDIYKEQIDRYMNEYENLSFSNNFNEKMEEIIDAAMAACDDSIPIDEYVQCKVCHQSCKDLHEHERANCEPYEKMFNGASKPLIFEQIIGSDIWNWKAIERTSVYRPILNAHEKWNQLTHFITQVKEPVRIICKGERHWTLLIDRYEQHRLELVILPTLVSQSTVVNYLPDFEEIRNLKATFDRYDQEEQRNIFSKLQNNDQRVQSGNYYLFDTTKTNKYIEKNDFSFPIVDPPPEIYRERCYDCQKSFSFFIRHHHCRMCGQQYCVDCLIYKRIPHLGFIVKPVRICHKCSNEKEHFIYQHLFTYVKHLIESNRIQYLSVYLALLHEYKPNGDELFYRQSGENYYRTEQYSLAIQCYTYARVSSNEWLKYSFEFSKKNEYSYSLTCMRLCAKPDEFWLEQAASQSSSTFALLCYEHIKISIEQLFKIASEKSTNDMNTCLLYLLYLNIRNASQVNWKDLGEQALLKTNYDGSLAMLCFHLYGKMQSGEWNYLAEQLYQSDKLERLTYLLAYLYHVQQTDFRTCGNSYIYYLTKILLSANTMISLDDWLNDICDSSVLDINRIVIGLSISYAYQYTSWMEYKNHYIERKEYYKALICHKMVECLTGSQDTRWFVNAIEDLDPIGYELFDATNRSSDWKELGDQYFKTEKYIIALNCYLFCEQRQVDQIITQQAQTPMLPLPTALLYHTEVYKRTRGNNTKILSKSNSALCNNTFYNMCIVLAKQRNPYVAELVTSAIQMYETDSRFRNADLFKYHLVLLNELQQRNDEDGKNDRLINGGVHILLALDNLSEESMHNLTSLNEPLLIKSNAKVLNELKSSTYKSCPELTSTLLNPNNYFLQPLKQLLQQCLGRLKLSEVQPAEYRAKMYLIPSCNFQI